MCPNGMFEMEFSGAYDLPYQVWASTDIIDWNQIGTAAQLFPGVFNSKIRLRRIIPRDSIKSDCRKIIPYILPFKVDSRSKITGTVLTSSQEKEP